VQVDSSIVKRKSVADTSPTNRANPKGVRWRAVVIGLLLIPLNSYWIVRSETGGGIFYSTTSSLFCNVVFTLFVLTVLNTGIRRWFPKGGLTQGELLVIYSTIAVSSAMSGESVGQQLVRVIGTPFWYATPENEWAPLFHRYLPSGLVVDNRPILQAFFESGDGNASLLYTSAHFMVWLRPLLVWCAFVLCLAFLMVCVNLIVRKQWIEHEKLTYPVIQLPLAITADGDAFFRNGRMWMGFSIGAGITLLNGLHHLNPIVPGIRNINNFSHLFAAKPWNAMNPIVIAFYPCAIGLAYFMPLDLAFSTWFFFLFWKAQLVFGAIFGFRSIPGFPYAKWQQTGAYLSVGVLAIWVSRRQLFYVLRTAWKPDGAADSGEPVRYRTAVVGLIVGLSGIIVFGVQLGMALWAAFSFFGVYLVLSIAVTRMRAELGPLVHELYYSNAGQALTAVLGTRRLSPSSLTAMSMLWWLTRSQNSHLMPHQLEAFKLAERTKTSTRWFGAIMVVAAVLGTLFCSYAVLDVGYRYGGSAGFAPEAYRRLQSWLSHPQPPDIAASGFMGVGFLFAMFLLWMKRRFLWWPFHPLGYAVTQGDWAITYIWFPIFISWGVKTLILSYGGLRSHRNATPIFLGLILGDFMMGATWGLIGLATGAPTYRFKNW
jgi:hypothetical protein